MPAVIPSAGKATAPQRRMDHRGAVQAAPIVAMALVVVLLGVFLWMLQRNERQEEDVALIKNVLWVEQNLHFQLASDEEKLRTMAEALGRRDTGPAEALPQFSHILRTDPAIERLLWFDADRRLTAAMPPAGPDVPLDDALGSSHRGDAFLIARSGGRAVYTAAYTLPDGDARFDLLIPVFGPDGFDGVLVAVFSIGAILTHHVPWWFTEHYQVQVIDARGTVLGAKSHVAMPDEARTHTIPFEPPGHGLALVVGVHRTENNVARNVLLAAIFALTASALWSLWAVRRHIRRRVRAEEALRAEHAFRKAMEDSLTVGMRARDLEGRVTYVNPAFCRMVGWPAEELVGAGPAMPYWVPEEMEKTREAFLAVMSGRAPLDGFELRFRRRNGERFDALIYEAPLIDADGRHTGWMGSIVDITERKRADELARQQQERLQQTARLITMGEMASTLAHELNQPLSAIASYATGCLNRLKAGDGSAAELVPALEKLARQAMRAGQIIRRVHDFVRKRDPNVSAVALDQVVEDSVALFGPDARKHGVRIAVDVEPALPAALADRILVQQVLLNLMRNACEAMAATPREARRLELTVRREDGMLRTRIADHGCGIAPEVQERLFSPFFTTKTEGMGMGLNICRSIIEHHRGRLWFEPGPDGGAAFIFTLPLAEAEAAAA